MASVRAAAVQLRPLDAEAVRIYLCDDAADPAARARWNPVLAVLGTEVPAGQALATPLMVGPARGIYNPRPDELAGTVRDPAELCSPALADRAAVESLLFDAFIPAAYRPPREAAGQQHEPKRRLCSSPVTLSIRSAAPTWPGGNCAKPYHAPPLYSRLGSRSGWR